jgi:uncharacterized membrane protein
MNNRLKYIDVYRGLAILLMLHGHTTDALLNPTDKMSLAYQIYTIFRGFTAPMFLFISGFAFSVSTLKHIPEYTKPSEKFFKRIRKFFFIILLGYFLHLPYLSLQKLATESNFKTLAQLFSSDVLQVIGISLLSLQIALFALKDEFKFARFVLYAGVFSFIISPFFFMVNFSKYLPLFISQYLNNFNGSNFPLFPWIGFILLGSYIGHRFMLELKLGRVEIFLNKILKLSLLIFPLSLVLEALYNILFDPSEPLIYSSPFLAISRLSFVLILFYLIWRVEKLINLKIHPLQILGVESLFAYIFHLMVVYGSPLNPTCSYSAFWGGTLSYGYVFLLFLILLFTVFSLSYLLNIAKRKNFRLFNYLKYAVITAVSLVFFINPY